MIKSKTTSTVNDFNVDSLLEDLDEIVGSHSTPRPPVDNPLSSPQKSPKLKFLVQPGEASSNSLTPNSKNPTLSHAYFINSAGKTGSTGGPRSPCQYTPSSSHNNASDIPSIDDLLQMLDVKENEPTCISQKLFISPNNNIETSTPRSQHTCSYIEKAVKSVPYQAHVVSDPLNNSFDSSSPRVTITTSSYTKLSTNINDCNSSMTPVTNKNRCNRVALGGGEASRGYRSSAFSKTVCNRMRCMNCNFMVRCYRDARWKSTVDYMFFRNNIPNDDKLSAGLDQTTCAAAYCCQCSWIDVADEVIVAPGDTNAVQWICAGHS